MKIKVGTTNKAKVDAVCETVANYQILKDAQIESVEVSSEVSDQPKGLEETIQGAVNRAKNAFCDCDYSFGIESGIFPVPYTKSGYLDTCACVVYDGKDFHLGLSSCFEYPKELVRLVNEEGMNITQAANKVGFSKNEKLGAAEGMVGILTKGRLPRKEYTKQAITTALIHLENKEVY